MPSVCYKAMDNDYVDAHKEHGPVDCFLRGLDGITLLLDALNVAIPL